MKPEDFPKNLKELTPAKQLEITKMLVKDAGLKWENLSDQQKKEWMIEASFCVSWLC